MRGLVLIPFAAAVIALAMLFFATRGTHDILDRIAEDNRQISRISDLLSATGYYGINVYQPQDENRALLEKFQASECRYSWSGHKVKDDLPYGGVVCDGTKIKVMW